MRDKPDVVGVILLLAINNILCMGLGALIAGLLS